jgi:WD40 repeat protein
LLLKRCPAILTYFVITSSLATASAIMRRSKILFTGLVFLPLFVLKAAAQEQPRLRVQDVMDLERDRVNVVAFSPVTRELFVSHLTENDVLRQWSIEKRKLVHTYSCPQRNARWDELAVSPDGMLLVASTYPSGSPPFRKSQVLFIDTASHRVRHTAEYDYLIRTIRFDRAGRFIWLSTTDHGADDFVFDRDGKKHTDFKAADFEPETRERLWDVPANKGGPPEGLFYRDTSGTVHRLASDPLNQHYALSKDSAYIGTSTWDRRIRIWRTADRKEVFNEVIGAHPVRLIYDSKENAFLLLDGTEGNTCLRSIALPRQANRAENEDPVR